MNLIQEAEPDLYILCVSNMCKHYYTIMMVIFYIFFVPRDLFAEGIPVGRGGHRVSGSSPEHFLKIDSVIN